MFIILRNILRIVDLSFQKRFFKIQISNPIECQKYISNFEENHLIHTTNHAIPHKLLCETNSFQSNVPTEDRYTIGKCTYTEDVFAAVFDGHLGSSMSHLLSQRFLNYLAIAFLPNSHLKNILIILKQNYEADYNEYQAKGLADDINIKLQKALLGNINIINSCKYLNNAIGKDLIKTPNIPWHYYIKYIEHLIVQNDTREQLISQALKDETLLTHQQLFMLRNEETFVSKRLEQAFIYYDEYVLKLAEQEIEDTHNSLLKGAEPANGTTSSTNILSEILPKFGSNHKNLDSNEDPTDKIEDVNLLDQPLSIKLKNRAKTFYDHMVGKKSNQKFRNRLSSLNCGSAPPWVRCALSGSTACVAYIKYPSPSAPESELKDNENVENIDFRKEPAVLYIANLGDSRAVLGSIGPNGEWVTTKLSYKHYGENSWEVKRIKSEHQNESEKSWLFRNGRLLGFLMPTRSFGDAMLKWPFHLIIKARKLFPSLNIFVPSNYISPPYLSAKPEVISHVLRPEDKFVVIATDGLWDFLHTRQVVKILGDRWNRKRQMENRTDEGYGSDTNSIIDDVSNEDNLQPVIGIDFRPSSHEDLNAKSDSKSSIITKEENGEKPSQDFMHHYYVPNDSSINSATSLIEHALGGYGTVNNDVRNFKFKHPLNKTDGNTSDNKTSKIDHKSVILNYSKLSTLLSLPAEISRDFRDDITVVVINFEN